MKKYYVTAIDKYNEEVILATDNLEEAIKKAQSEQRIIERDRRKDFIEIRVYTEDIEDEDCDCFDYETVEF